MEIPIFRGCHKVNQDGVTSYRFAIWRAPHAANVYILGDFNHWQNEPLSHIEAGVLGGREGAERSQCYKVGIDHGNGHIEYRLIPLVLALRLRLRMLRWLGLGRL